MQIKSRLSKSTRWILEWIPELVLLGLIGTISAFYGDRIIQIVSQKFVISTLFVIVLSVWAYRTDSLDRFINGNFQTDKNKKESETASSGPFEPAVPMIMVPDDLYFVEPFHKPYNSHNRLTTFYHYCDEAKTEIIMPVLLILAFGLLMSWFFIGISWSSSSTIDAIMWIFGDIFFTFIVVSVSRTMALWWKIWLCDRLASRYGMPLLGRVLKCRITRFSRSKAKYFNVYYVLTTPQGRQIEKTIRYKAIEGHPPPSPGASLVVMYVDDNCHMPL